MRRNRFLPRHLVGLLACTCVIAGVPLSAPGAKPRRTPEEIKQAADQAKEQRLKLNKLQTTAMGADPAAAATAMKELESLGEPGKAAIANVITQLITRERTKAEAAARPAGDPKQARAAEEALDAERRATLEHLAKLTKAPESTKLAKAHFDKLVVLYSKVQPAYANRAAAFELVAKRADLKQTWDRLMLTAAPSPFDPAAEEHVGKIVTQALGVPLERVAQLVAPPAPGTAGAASPAPTPAPETQPAAATQPAASTTQPAGAPDEPAEVELRPVWRFWLHRRAEAHHRGLRALLDPAEAEHMRMVNQYRELLGLPPVEGDPRLTQAARRHAKEMAEKKYVDHTSMTDGQRDPQERAKAAGFPGAPVVENIAGASGTPDAAFWALFNSPEEHRNLVDPRHTAVGVGKWQDKWVQVFGTSDRVLLASEQARSTVTAGGEVQPQSVVRAAAAAEAAAKRAQARPPATPK